MLRVRKTGKVWCWRLFLLRWKRLTVWNLAVQWSLSSQCLSFRWKEQSALHRLAVMFENVSQLQQIFWYKGPFSDGRNATSIWSQVRRLRETFTSQWAGQFQMYGYTFRVIFYCFEQQWCAFQGAVLCGVSDGWPCSEPLRFSCWMHHRIPQFDYVLPWYFFGFV